MRRASEAERAAEGGPGPPPSPATAGENDLTVLDEPTTGMDVTTRQAFWATMREQADQGRTVLFATHYVNGLAPSARAAAVSVGSMTRSPVRTLRIASASWAATHPHPRSHTCRYGEGRQLSIALAAEASPRTRPAAASSTASNTSA